MSKITFSNIMAQLSMEGKIKRIADVTVSDNLINAFDELFDKTQLPVNLLKKILEKFNFEVQSVREIITLL